MLQLDELRLSAARQENESLSNTVRGLESLHRSALIFLCECQNPYCSEFVKLTLREYDALRHAEGAILHPDHQSTTADRDRAA
jgi:hypothetical protein